MTGKELEKAAQELWKTPRICWHCGRKHNSQKSTKSDRLPPEKRPRHNVRPILAADSYDERLRWGCEACYPPAKGLRENKELIDVLTVPMFSDENAGYTEPAK